LFPFAENTPMKRRATGGLAAGELLAELDHAVEGAVDVALSHVAVRVDRLAAAGGPEAADGWSLVAS